MRGVGVGCTWGDLLVGWGPGVKVASRPVRAASPAHVTGEPGCVVGGMWEDIIAAAVGLALVGYLLYALVRPDRF